MILSLLYFPGCPGLGTMTHGHTSGRQEGTWTSSDTLGPSFTPPSVLDVFLSMVSLSIKIDNM